ncbi:MAG: PAS domain S-box protein, partial [Chloroflexia bacterium]
MTDTQDKMNSSGAEGVIDDAEHRRILDDIQREKEFSESLINSSFDGILAFDHDCRYTIWNPGMERITGLSAQDVLGRVAFEIFPFLKETGEDQFFWEALAGRTAIGNDRPFVIPQTGQGGFFEARYSPLCNASGEVIGGLGIIRDITERSRADKALRDSESKYRMLMEYASDGIDVALRAGLAPVKVNMVVKRGTNDDQIVAM